MDFFKTNLGRSLAMLLCLFLAITSVKALVDATTGWNTYHDQYRNVITVSADDKVVAKPDIASLNLSVVSKGASVSQVSTDGNQKMTAIVNALKGMQIDEKDIETTNYSLVPEQDYSIDRVPNQAPKIVGYTLTQSLNVKVRKLDQVSDVLQKATSLGANSMDGINFTIDNSDQLKDQAREKAFSKAKAKAETLAKQAGVSLGKIVSFNDDSVSPMPYDSYYNKAMPMSAAAEAVPAPSIETGSQEVHASVSITYEIN